MVQVQQQAIFPFPGLPQGTVYTDGYDRPSYLVVQQRSLLVKIGMLYVGVVLMVMIHSFHFKIVSIILKESMY